MRTPRVRVAWVFVCLMLLVGCSSAGGLSVAVPDRELDARWQQAGDDAGPSQWSGADGTSSVALPGGRVAWFFSDTFLGPVNSDGSRPADTAFVHNSLVVQDGDRLTTVRTGTPVRPPTGTPGWYWVGAGTVQGGRLVEFYHRLIGSSGWDFTEQGVAMATFSLPDLRLEQVRELPAGWPPAGRTPVMWGAALTDAGGWTYIYGYQADLTTPAHAKRLYIARVRRGHLTDVTAWRYETGAGWSADPATAAELPTRVDAGFSVTRIGGEYALVTRQPSGDLSDGTLMAYLAHSPTGPFRDSDTAILYHAPETSDGQFVYEARTHPELGGHDSVVVSYNVNSTLVDGECTAQNLRQASVYRPRFIVVPTSAFRRGYAAPAPSRPASVKPPNGWFASCSH